MQLSADSAQWPELVDFVVGVNTVRLYPAGDTVGDRLDTLARALDLVRSR